jgi:hypothetical protein
MYATLIPAHQSRSSQTVSTGWYPLYERASDVLAEPFFGPVSIATLCPEAALMCAVLEDAFLCFQKQFEIEKRGIRTAQEAEEWFFSDDSHWLFSFASICTVLGLEPEVIRHGLNHWSQSRLDTPQRKMYRLIGANHRGLSPEQQK